MSNQSKGRKISEFLGQSSIPSDAQLTYISGGVNYKISLAEFLASIGVTGTIVQDGDPLGTPVLDTAGAVNNIRNVEDGSGIKSSVSAQNGLTLEHNFIEDTSGVTLVADLTADQPKFRSLVAGAGINIAGSNGSIQITLSATPVSTKTVIVNDINDFPASVAGVITLEDDTEYAIRNDISTVNRFVLGNNCVLGGSDNSVINLTYTGSSTFFTSTNKTWKLKSISITCLSGALVAFSGTGTEIFQLGDVTITADTLGTISDFGGLQFDDVQLAVTTNGFVFGGSNNVALMESMLNTVAAGTLIDLGTATFNAISITECFNTLNGTSVFLDGLANSGNMSAGGLGTVHNCRFFGTGTPLQTLDVGDIRWQYFINDDIEDTHKDCLMSQAGNLVETVIAVASTPVLLAGTWTEEHQEQFSTTTAGRMTYNGIKDVHVDITMSFSAAPVSGTNKAINFYPAKNGSVIPNAEAFNNISSGDPSRTTVIWRIVMATGDYVEAFVENDTDNINVLVTDAVMRIS